MNACHLEHTLDWTWNVQRHSKNLCSTYRIFSKSLKKAFQWHWQQICRALRKFWCRQIARIYQHHNNCRAVLIQSHKTACTNWTHVDITMSRWTQHPWAKVSCMYLSNSTVTASTVILSNIISTFGSVSSAADIHRKWRILKSQCVCVCACECSCLCGKRGGKNLVTKIPKTSLTKLRYIKFFYSSLKQIFLQFIKTKKLWISHQLWRTHSFRVWVHN